MDLKKIVTNIPEDNGKKNVEYQCACIECGWMGMDSEAEDATGIPDIFYPEKWACPNCCKKGTLYGLDDEMSSIYLL